MLESGDESSTTHRQRVCVADLLDFEPQRAWKLRLLSRPLTRSQVLGSSAAAVRRMAAELIGLPRTGGGGGDSSATAAFASADATAALVSVLLGAKPLP